MTATIRKSLAVILAIAMILALLPFAMVNAFAENNTAEQTETPVLNKTIVGTVTFQSFNFLGDNATGEDGTEYNTTFYYSDDYFSASAINDAVNSKSVTWDKLDNVALATTSMDFTVASMTSSINNVVSPSDRSWDNTYYKNENGKGEKFANAYSFLEACGFENLQQNELDEKPTMDSIGSTIGSKTIRVWDEETQSNKEFTLVAVGVRGAGYDSEWASNITIGDPRTNQIPENGRHFGFDDSAKEICRRIRAYNDAYGIDSNVKYWITGFSRAAAVANLAAGYLTDDADTYHTAQKDIYAYTWECPQAAASSENALKYKNIHNIINPMDAVPKVSPDAFEHQRLGVDYQMPYHGNAGSDNKTYYERMQAVLKTIAVGNGTKADKLVDAIDEYPYDTPMTMYTMTALQITTDAATGNLMDNFGTVKSKKKSLFSGNVNKVLGDTDNDGKSDWYLDQFIDELINVFLTSSAWDRDYPDYGSTVSVMEHRSRFISNYQNDFRVLLGYLLDFSGPAFLSMLDQLKNQLWTMIKGTVKSGFIWDFVFFYNNQSESNLNAVISSGQTVMVDVINSMTEGYEHPTISRTEMNDALRHLVALVFSLYSDELNDYEAQYFGTCLHLMDVILSTHEQETVLSWIMSLDDNHINRGYRTLTVPKDANVTMHVFRDGIDPEMSATANGPVIATFEDGKLASLDQRIYYSPNGNNVTIRYPSSLNIRTDVTTDKDIANFTYSVRDYQTKSATQGISDGPNQYKALTNAANYTEITNKTDKTNAKSVNENAVTSELTEENALQIMAHASTTFDNHADGDANVYEVKNSPRYKITFKDDDDTVLYEQRVIEGMMPVYQGEEPTKEETLTQSFEFKGWTPVISEAEEDTVYTAEYEVTDKLRIGHSISLKGNIGVNFYYYISDVIEGEKAITFRYRGEEYEGTLVPSTKSGYNYMATYTVPAKEMTEPITATLTCDGEVLDSHDYTVRDYARIIIQNSNQYGEKLTKLARSMVNYGAFAQRHFNYNTNHLADEGLDGYEMFSTDDVAAPTLDKDALNESIKAYGLKYYGQSVVLKTETAVRVYFKLQNSGFDGSIPLKINGTDAEWKYSGTDYVYAEIANIPAKNIGDIHTIQIGDAVFQFSAQNYMETVLRGEDEALKDVVTALHDYWLRAKAYFGN